MIEWRRVLGEKRRVLVPLLVAAILNVLVYFAVVYPMTAREATMDARGQAAAVRAATAQRAFRAAEATRSGRARADQQLARFYAEILPRDQAAARRITYARLAKLADEANLDYENRTSTVAHDDESELERLDTSMTLQGDYRDIRAFLHTLESTPEFVVIKDIGLALREPDAPLTLTLNLATYFRAVP